MRFDYAISERLAIEFLEQVEASKKIKASKKIADFFVEANKREDNLEFIMEEHRRLLKNRKD